MTPMGSEAVKVLIERIEHPDKPARSRSFDARLIVRQSCGCSGVEM
jgi:DNA-binding LacI/PurR family transcriptional regulator